MDIILAALLKLSFDDLTSDNHTFSPVISQGLWQVQGESHISYHGKRIASAFSFGFSDIRRNRCLLQRGSLVLFYRYRESTLSLLLNDRALSGAVKWGNYNVTLSIPKRFLERMEACILNTSGARLMQPRP